MCASVYFLIRFTRTLIILLVVSKTDSTFMEIQLSYFIKFYFNPYFYYSNVLFLVLNQDMFIYFALHFLINAFTASSFPLAKDNEKYWVKL